MMSTLPASHARRAGMLFADSSVSTKGVHFSFQVPGDEKLNLQIPASQISALINSLVSCRKMMREHGVDCGNDRDILIPTVPYRWFDGG